MPLEVVHGESRNRQVASALANQLSVLISEGTVYLGYPVLATADERVEVDALLVSREHGLVAFLLADVAPSSAEEWVEVVSSQDRLFGVLESYLGRHENLRRGRKLAVEPNTATVFATSPSNEGRPASADDGFYGSIENVGQWVASLASISEVDEKNLQAALQRVTTIKPAKRRAAVASHSSRGAILKSIERGIANLDRWQKAAAIESPEGPQRIRGLAGSGKTVVLALKAAYWHAQHPLWRIALTFHSRALYQQMDDLVTRFTFEHINDRPDPEQLQIIHSWGSRSRPGIYSMIASALGEPVRDYNYARGIYGIENSFQGVCQELLQVANARPRVSPLFDAVLIDEAQDLPPEFFQLVYKFTREPKRIVWGFDELQKLSESAMPSTDELFGVGPAGESLISLESRPGEPRRDIVLPVCYRNTPWALATAHALGTGVYRHDGLLQHPDEPTLWRDIGYDILHGRLAAGSRVTLVRSRESYPEYFDRMLTSNDAVVLRQFSDRLSQDQWVASQIAENLGRDELEHDDILIVLPDSYRAKSRAPDLMRELARRNVRSHLVGVNTSRDEIFQPGSVAIAHIYRAKGNEAPMVYAIDTQYAAGSFNAVTRRNTLFTAITRSRAWVRIVGWGQAMDPIVDETRRVVENSYKLSFQIPTAVELNLIRHVYRDRPERDERVIRKAADGLSAWIEAVDRGDVDLYDLPPAVRTRLINQMRSSETPGDDA